MRRRRIYHLLPEETWVEGGVTLRKGGLFTWLIKKGPVARRETGKGKKKGLG